MEHELEPMLLLEHSADEQDEYTSESVTGYESASTAKEG